MITSLNELEAVVPPPRLPLVTEFVPAWAVFSFVLEASDLESSWPARGFDGAMSKKSRYEEICGWTLAGINEVGETNCYDKNVRIYQRGRIVNG